MAFVNLSRYISTQCSVILDSLNIDICISIIKVTRALNSKAL